MSRCGLPDSCRLTGETDFLVASDSGEVEVWNCHPPGNTLEYKTALGSHDDMALCLCRTADHERVVSGGADCKLVLSVIKNYHTCYSALCLQSSQITPRGVTGGC